MDAEKILKRSYAEYKAGTKDLVTWLVPNTASPLDGPIQSLSCRPTGLNIYFIMVKHGKSRIKGIHHFLSNATI
jgi:hypothetical protein